MSDKVIENCAFMDQGSMATFCTEDLMHQLTVQHRKTELLLTTMGQENKVNSSILFDPEVSGLEEENYIELPQVFTQQSIQVKKENIPQQKDLSRWHYHHEVSNILKQTSAYLLVPMFTRPLNPEK